MAFRKPHWLLDERLTGWRGAAHHFDAARFQFFVGAQ
jgi:hypothetical protein